MISKELLCEVLMTRTIQMNPILESNNMVGYLVYGNQNNISQIRSNHKQINIYELAHKCKEWALKQGYNFRTYDNHYDLMKLSNGRFECVAEFSEKSEQQSCFNCCQWILENKEK